MSSGRRLSSGLALDAATLVLLLTAVWTAMQPESLLRRRLATSVADWRAGREVREHWTELREIAVGLHSDGKSPDVVVFTDYLCPFCRSLEATLDSAEAAGAAVAVALIPRSGEPVAALAAQAVICASEQQRGADLHRAPMRSDEWMRTARADLMAGAVTGIDPHALQACLGSSRPADILGRLKRMSVSIGVTGTPTIVAPGRVHRGTATLDQLLAVAVRR